MRLVVVEHLPGAVDDFLVALDFSRDLVLDFQRWEGNRFELQIAEISFVPVRLKWVRLQEIVQKVRVQRIGCLKYLDTVCALSERPFDSCLSG